MSIQITKLNFSYPSSSGNLFEDFSLQIGDGWTCIAGSNGCGKSTLLKLIAGLIKADGGKISFEGNAMLMFSTILLDTSLKVAPLPKDWM